MLHNGSPIAATVIRSRPDGKSPNTALAVNNGYTHRVLGEIMRRIHVKDIASLIGEPLPPSNWRLVDQELINRFADVTGDHQWIHIDVPRAKQELGGTIAHGFLTLSLMSAMAKETLEVDGLVRAFNYGFERVRFTGVVPAGSRIRMTANVAKVEPKSGGLLVTRSCAVEVEHQPKPVIVADWLGLYFAA
jgi:acyl dehydratase